MREGSYFDNQNQCSIYHITLLLKTIHMIFVILIAISVLFTIDFNHQMYNFNNIH